MSATRIPQQIDGLSTLKDLLDLIKNPQSLTTASEIARKEMALTDAEKAKVDQARKDLREHASKMDILQTSKEELEKAKEAHKEQVAVATASLTSRAESLDALAQTLHEHESRLIAKDKTHAEERKQLDAHSSDIQRSASDINDKLSKREAAVKKSEESVASAAIRVEADRKKLAEKLRLLSE